MDSLLRQFLMRTNHGHTVINIDADRCLILTPDGAGFSDSAQLKEISSGGEKVFTFADPSGSGILKTAGRVISSAICADKNGCLFAGIGDESGISVMRTISPVSDFDEYRNSQSWEKIASAASAGYEIFKSAVLGDFFLDHHGNLIVMCVKTIGGESEIFAASWHAYEWSLRHIAKGRQCFAPVAAADTNGTIHVAWSDMCQRLYYTHINSEYAGSQQEPKLICTWGRNPAITVLQDRKVLIAFEPEFSHAISYVLIDGQTIKVYGDDDQVLTQSPADVRFGREVFHSPQFSLDRNGVTWLYFIDTIRRQVFGAAWLGSGWGPVCEITGIRAKPVHRDYNFLPIGRLSAAKSSGNSDPGLYLQAQEPAPTHAFHKVLPAQPRMQAGTKILFLDMKEIAYTSGFVRAAGKAEKCVANPILKPSGDSAAFDCKRVFNSGIVTCENDEFRMWYVGIGNADTTIPWWHWYQMGYAQSTDGLEWRRPNLNICPAPNQNCIPGMPASIALCRDDKDHPDHRYKMLQGFVHSHTRELELSGQLDPEDARYHGYLFTSPDGLAWKKQPITMACPGGMHLEFVPQSLLRDDDDPDPARRFKAYGWTSLTQGQRAVAMAFSPDALQWTAYEHNPVLAPELRGYPYVPAGPYSHIHDCVVFKYSGFYLALYQYLHHPLAADIELAISRDGFNFNYVNCGKKIIERGGPGQWDRGMLVPSVPLIRADEIWFYYGGTDYHHDSDGPIQGARENTMVTSAGLAKMRLDGFGCLESEDGISEAVLETVPMLGPNEPVAIVVNAQCPQTEITAEICDASAKRALPGFSYDQSIPATGDAVRIPLRWVSHDRLKPQTTPIRIRIKIKNAVGCASKLFSIGFETLQ